LAPLYASDGELIAFTALDGEDVIEKLHGVIQEGPSLTEDLLKERAHDQEKEESRINQGAGDD